MSSRETKLGIPEAKRARLVVLDRVGVGIEDSQLICAYLDGLDGKPRFHNASHAFDWAYLRLEFAARSMCDGIAVWGRKWPGPRTSVRRLLSPMSQRAPSAWQISSRITQPIRSCKGRPAWRNLILAVAVEMARKRGLGDLTAGRQRLASWMRSVSDLPSMQRTVPP